MKKFILGVATGVVVMLLVVLGLMLTGTRFQSVIFKYGPYEGHAVVACPKFIIVYMDGRQAGAGCCPVTISGRSGELPAFWDGHGTGFSGDATGIDMLHTYEPRFGVATIFVHGHIIRVENEGTDLRVQDKIFRLGPERIVVVVDEKGYAWPANAAETATIVTSLPKWFTDNEPLAYPLGGFGENAAAAVPLAESPPKRTMGKR
jgi:hypothetical protein